MVESETPPYNVTDGLCDASLLRQAISHDETGCDGILHLSGLSSPGSREQAMCREFWLQALGSSESAAEGQEWEKQFFMR